MKKVSENFIYCKMFHFLESKFKNHICIIHNDISLNNIINSNGKLFSIDFDFCINSFEVVDIVNNFDEFTSTIDDCCRIYKK